MRRHGAIAVVVMMVSGISACSAGGYGAGPSGSTSTASNAAGAVTVSIVGINGDQSFFPNPATLSTGQTIIWHNADAITHRVVLNDGSVDTGNLAPGASSQPVTLRVGGSQYHCSIHPDMIGSINQTTSSGPSPTTTY